MRTSLVRIITAVSSKIWHLFVDGGLFAAAIIFWPCLIWLLDRLGLLTGASGSAMLAVGMVVILVVGTVRNTHPRASK
jgi:cytochrome c oxidase assembly factor CtaG